MACVQLLLCLVRSNGTTLHLHAVIKIEGFHIAARPHLLAVAEDGCLRVELARILVVGFQAKLSAAAVVLAEAKALRQVALRLRLRLGGAGDWCWCCCRWWRWAIVCL